MALWEKLERYKKLLLNQYFFQSSEFYEAKVSDQIFWSFATKNVKERFFKRNYSHIFVKNYLWEKGWQNPNHSKGWWPSSSWPAIDYNWIQGIQEQPKRTLLPCADGMGSSIRRCFKKTSQDLKNWWPLTRLKQTDKVNVTRRYFAVSNNWEHIRMTISRIPEASSKETSRFLSVWFDLALLHQGNLHFSHFEFLSYATEIGHAWRNFLFLYLAIDF